MSDELEHPWVSDESEAPEQDEDLELHGIEEQSDHIKEVKADVIEAIDEGCKGKGSIVDYVEHPRHVVSLALSELVDEGVLQRTG